MKAPLSFLPDAALIAAAVFLACYIVYEVLIVPRWERMIPVYPEPPACVPEPEKKPDPTQLNVA